MAAPQQDIRVTKTHKALAEALVSLSEKKPFPRITVNDICQTAMVSRSTFYLHFEDKFQLLLFCLQMERDRLKEKIQSLEDPRRFFGSIFLAVRERKQVYYNLFRADINQELSQMFYSFFHSAFLELLLGAEQQGMTLNGPPSILAAYHSSGIAGMMMQWIQEDFRYSVEEMSLCLYELVADFIPD